MKKFRNPFSFQVDYDRKSIFQLASDKEKEEQTSAGRSRLPDGNRSRYEASEQGTAQVLNGM